jgi:hypothetical protein
MKRTLLISFGALALLAVGMVYSVFHAAHDPVTHTPGPVETGRAQLHAQFEEAKKRETAAEQQDWDSPARLGLLVKGHGQRIEQLKDNKEAAEIVSYDRASIDRLQKRIAQIAEAEAAKAEAAKETALQAARQAAAARESEQQ